MAIATNPGQWKWRQMRISAVSRGADSFFFSFSLFLVVIRWCRPQDYYTTARSQPNADAQQDYIMKMATQKDGYTTLVFYRKMNTGDSANDVEIKVRAPFWVLDGCGPCPSLPWVRCRVWVRSKEGVGGDLARNQT